MRNRERWALAAAGAALLIAAAPAAETAKEAASSPPRQRVVTMTRFVKVFSDLEFDLIDALRAKNAAAIDRLLAEEFEQRNAAQPGVPLPRDEWLRSGEAVPAGQPQLTELAVHDRAELAIASFRLKLAEREWFIVDVWRKKADSYELVTRYASPLR